MLKKIPPYVPMLLGALVLVLAIQLSARDLGAEPSPAWGYPYAPLLAMALWSTIWRWMNRNISKGNKKDLAVIGCAIWLVPLVVVIVGAPVLAFLLVL